MKITQNKILSFLSGFIFLVFSGVCSGQAAEINLFGGLSNYLGDLNQKLIASKNMGKVVGINFKYPLTEHFWLRGSVAKGKLAGHDKDNSPELRVRNLSFQTGLTDGYIAVEYRLFSPDRSAITPYVFSGGGIFHFNPYVHFGDKNEKVYLQPLGTEGQGLPEYPDRKMYKLTKFFIPLGGGLLWTLNDKWFLGIEFRNNVTFTDYLDDVSDSYALQGPLLRDRGPLAVELAWRRDEYDGRSYPTVETSRGNPNNNDWYYYLGLHVGFKLQSGSANSSYKKGKNQLGCPKW
jgi:hypothetical protein